MGRKLKVETGKCGGAGEGWVLLEGCQVTEVPPGVGVYSCPFLESVYTAAPSVDSLFSVSRNICLGKNEIQTQ